eukprot:s2614_g12.t1
MKIKGSQQEEAGGMTWAVTQQLRHELLSIVSSDVRWVETTNQLSRNAFLKPDVGAEPHQLSPAPWQCGMPFEVRKTSGRSSNLHLRSLPLRVLKDVGITSCSADPTPDAGAFWRHAMGRALAPPPPALPPLEDVPARQMPKTMPSSPSQGDVKRLKRPGARYFPAEETTLVYPSRPAVPKPTVARPLNENMKGFGWRVTEERIRPSADLADKVYFAPVVPGLPPQRKRPRRPRILEPLAPSMASVAQLRNKVMGALDSALRSERVPQDMRYRLLGTVEQVMDSEMDVPELEPQPPVKKPQLQDPAHAQLPPPPMMHSPPHQLPALEVRQRLKMAPPLQSPSVSLYSGTKSSSW